MSTIAFIGSGVIGALLNYFTSGYFSKYGTLEAEFPKLQQQAIRWYKSFVAVALQSNIGEEDYVSEIAA